MKPYTDEEIQSKHETVRRQIAGLTHGLLEMTNSYGPLFISRRIQFFHRTARDFVLENAHLQKFHAKTPGITSHQTHLRLDIAELWFSRPGLWTIYKRGSGHYCRGVSDPTLFQALAKVRAYHNSGSSRLTFGGTRNTPGKLSNLTERIHPPVPESQLHYIISKSYASEYIKSVASQGRQLLEERDELSCLLSACLSENIWGLPIENVRCLLSLGLSPRKLVLVHYEATSDKEELPPDMGETYVPVWSLFLVFVVRKRLMWPVSVNLSRHDRHWQEPWDVVEMLLKYGGYGDSFFLLADIENLSVPVYVISLQELIRQWSPQN
jgi:hypothetical protein